MLAPPTSASVDVASLRTLSPQQLVRELDRVQNSLDHLRRSNVELAHFVHRASSGPSPSSSSSRRIEPSSAEGAGQAALDEGRTDAMDGVEVETRAAEVPGRDDNDEDDDEVVLDQDDVEELRQAARENEATISQEALLARIQRVLEEKVGRHAAPVPLVTPSTTDAPHDAASTTAPTTTAMGGELRIVAAVPGAPPGRGMLLDDEDN